MTRPFASLCPSLIIGILLYHHINISIDKNVFLLLFVFLLFLILLFPRQNTLFIQILFILLGSFLYYNQLAYPTILRNYHQDTIALQGRIQDIVNTSSNYIEYDLEIAKIITDHQEIGIKEKARLRYFRNGDLLQPGDIVRINHAIIKEKFMSEDLEGYKKHLRSKGYNLFLEAGGGEIQKITNTSTINMIHTSYQIRRYIEDFFDISLPAMESSLLKSILFGNQGYMHRNTLAMFSKSGTAHIIAVSGLHIGLMVLLTHWVFKFLGLGRNKILLLTMLILFIYSYIVGFPISIIRASVMYYLYVFAYFLNRRYDGINAVMMIASLLLIYSPVYIFSVSFQLSFIATLSILLFYPLLREGLSILPRSLASLLAVTLAAQIGTIPIIAYYFNEISLIAFVANLLIIPVLTPVLAIAFFSIFLSLLPMRIEIISNFILNKMLNYIGWIVEKLSQFPFASVEMQKINIFYIMVYYVMLTIVYLIIWENKQQKRKGRNTYELQGSNEEVES